MKFLLVILLSFQLLKSAEFDEQLSKYAWHMYQVSNCDGESVNNWTCNTCQYFTNMQNVKYFKNSTTMTGTVFTGYDKSKDLIIFSFMGTKDIQGSILDAIFFKIVYNECPNCEVHRGFLQYYEDIQKFLLNSYQDLKNQYPSSKILVTGHSLGAAASHFLIVDLWKKFQQQVHFYYHFESPRVGNLEFAQYVDSISINSWRIVHDRDIVPHLPTQNMGYVHTNTEVWYNQDCTSYQICTEREQRNCSWSIPMIFGKGSQHCTVYQGDCSCQYDPQQNF